VVNPGSELAVPLGRDDLARLHNVPPREGDADLLIGEPREDPAETIEAIRRSAPAGPRSAPYTGRSSCSVRGRRPSR
jgi:hypothetical protein